MDVNVILTCSNVYAARHAHEDHTALNIYWRRSAKNIYPEYPLATENQISVNTSRMFL